MKPHEKEQSRVILCTRTFENSTPSFVNKINTQESTIVVNTLRGINEYRFDGIIGQDNEQDTVKVFAGQVAPLLDHFSLGGNSCFISYGQKGLGKSEFLNAKEGGLIVESIRYLFETQEVDELEFSAYKITNQGCADLLIKNSIEVSTENGRKSEKRDRELYSSNSRDMSEYKTGQPLHSMSSVKIKSLDEYLHHESRARNEMDRLVKNRFANYSNSHIIYTFTKKDQFGNKEGTLTVVDLACSEKIRKSVYMGGKLLETVEKSSSLQNFSKSINYLLENKREAITPEDPLIEAIYEALGGNCKTCYIVTVSLADCDKDQTFNSLAFAQKLSSIENKVASLSTLYSKKFNMSKNQKESTLEKQMIVIENGSSQKFNNLGADWLERCNSMIEGNTETEMKKLRDRNLKLESQVIELEKMLHLGHLDHSSLSQANSAAKNLSFFSAEKEEVYQSIQIGVTEHLIRINSSSKKSVEGELTKQKKAYAQLASEMDDLKARYEEDITEFARFKSEVEKTKSADIHLACRNERDSLLSQNEELQHLYQNTQSENAKLVHDYNRKIEELELKYEVTRKTELEIRAALQAVRKEKEEKEASLMESLERTKVQLHMAESSLQKLSEENKNMQYITLNQDERLRQALKAKDEFEQQVNSLRATLQSHNTKDRQREIHSETLSTENENLKSRMRNLEDQLKAAEKVASILEKQKMKESEELQAALVDIQELKAKNLELRSKNDELRERFEDTRSKYEGARQLVEDFRGRLEELKVTAEDYRSRAEEYKSRADDAKFKLSDLKNKNEDLKTKTEILKAENDIIKTEADALKMRVEDFESIYRQGTKKSASKRDASPVVVPKLPTGITISAMRQEMKNQRSNNKTPSEFNQHYTNKENDFDYNAGEVSQFDGDDDFNYVSQTILFTQQPSQRSHKNDSSILRQNTKENKENQGISGLKQRTSDIGQFQDLDSVINKSPLLRRQAKSPLQTSNQARRQPLQPTTAFDDVCKVEQKRGQLRDIFDNLAAYYSAEDFNKSSTRELRNRLKPQDLKTSLKRIWSELSSMRNDDSVSLAAQLELSQDLISRLFNLIEVVSEMKEEAVLKYFNLQRTHKEILTAYHINLKFWGSLNIDPQLVNRKMIKFIRQRRAVNVLVRFYRTFRRSCETKKLQRLHKTHYQLFQAGSGKFLLQNLMQKTEDFFLELSTKMNRPDQYAPNRSQVANPLAAFKKLHNITNPN